MGLEAKDKRLTRHACPVGMEDSSDAWGADDGYDIPVMLESKNRVLGAKLGAILHQKIRA